MRLRLHSSHWWLRLLHSHCCCCCCCCCCCYYCNYCYDDDYYNRNHNHNHNHNHDHYHYHSHCHHHHHHYYYYDDDDDYYYYYDNDDYYYSCSCHCHLVQQYHQYLYSQLPSPSPAPAAAVVSTHTIVPNKKMITLSMVYDIIDEALCVTRTTSRGLIAPSGVAAATASAVPGIGPTRSRCSQAPRENIMALILESAPFRRCTRDFERAGIVAAISAVGMWFDKFDRRTSAPRKRQTLRTYHIQSPG